MTDPRPESFNFIRVVREADDGRREWQFSLHISFGISTLALDYYEHKAKVTPRKWVRVADWERLRRRNATLEGPVPLPDDVVEEARVKLKTLLDNLPVIT